MTSHSPTESVLSIRSRVRSRPFWLNWDLAADDPVPQDCRPTSDLEPILSFSSAFESVYNLFWLFVENLFVTKGNLSNFAGGLVGLSLDFRLNFQLLLVVK